MFIGTLFLAQVFALSPGSAAESQQEIKSQFDLLSPERVELTKAAAELCWLTCVSSALNGEELIRSNGVDILGSLLVDCMMVRTHVTHLMEAALNITRLLFQVRALFQTMCSTLNLLYASSSDTPHRCISSTPGIAGRYPVLAHLCGAGYHS